MKKLLLLLVVALFTSNVAFSQVFEKGDIGAHVGIGFLSPYSYSGSKMGVPPVHASFEYGITDKIGVGALVGYTSSKWDLGYGTYDFSYIIAGARGSYHFYRTEKLDTYAGLMLGYNIASAKYKESTPSGSVVLADPKVGGFALGAYIGANYMFTEKIGAFAELGYSISWASVGLAVKL